MSEEIAEHSHPFPSGWEITADNRELGPTLFCACGGDGFYILAMFDEDRAVAGYFTDALCASCGTLLKAPTQADDEVFPREFSESDFFEPGLNSPEFDEIIEFPSSD